LTVRRCNRDPFSRNYCKAFLLHHTEFSVSRKHLQTERRCNDGLQSRSRCNGIYIPLLFSSCIAHIPNESSCEFLGAWSPWAQSLELAELANLVCESEVPSVMSDELRNTFTVAQPSQASNDDRYEQGNTRIRTATALFSEAGRHLETRFDSSNRGTCLPRTANYYRRVAVAIPGGYRWI
jgi:hypothetical protein